MKRKLRKPALDDFDDDETDIPFPLGKEMAGDNRNGLLRSNNAAAWVSNDARGKLIQIVATLDHTNPVPFYDKTEQLWITDLLEKFSDASVTFNMRGVQMLGDGVLSRLSDAVDENQKRHIYLLNLDPKLALSPFLQNFSARIAPDLFQIFSSELHEESAQIIKKARPLLKKLLGKLEQEELVRLKEAKKHGANGSSGDGSH